MSRFLKNIALGLWYFLSSFIVLSVIIFIFSYVFIKGYTSVNIGFILDSPKGTPLGMEGGILPAILGSLSLMFLACVNSAVLGVGTAIYLCLYCNDKRVENFIHLIVSTIAGIPSIVLGLFGYSFLVYFCGFGVSLISGGITLGIMIFPFIEVLTEKSIREVDKNLILSSYALGINKSYTFLHIILQECRGDIMSGIVMSGGFAMGAAAPVMMTSAVVSAPNPDSLFSPVMALPYHLYMLISQGISLQKAYGTALILIIILIILNMLAALLTKRKRG